MLARNSMIGIVVLFGAYKLILDGALNLTEVTQKNTLFVLACMILVLAFLVIWIALKGKLFPTDWE